MTHAVVLGAIFGAYFTYIIASIIYNAVKKEEDSLVTDV